MADYLLMSYIFNLTYIIYFSYIYYNERNIINGVYIWNPVMLHQKDS